MRCAGLGNATGIRRCPSAALIRAAQSYPNELGPVTVKLVAEGATSRDFPYFRRLRTATDRVLVPRSRPKGLRRDAMARPAPGQASRNHPDGARSAPSRGAYWPRNTRLTSSRRLLTPAFSKTDLRLSWTV